MGMELLMARARLNHLAAPGITFVGACTPQVGTPSGPTVVLGLPASARAGDVVVAQLIYASNNTSPPSTSGPVNSVQAVPDTHFVWFGTSLGLVAVYLVRLSSTDIAAATITFGVSPSKAMEGRGAIWRGVSQSALDGTASLAVSSAQTTTTPKTFTAPTLTTLTDGDMIVTGAGVDSTGSSDATLTTPTGYVIADSGFVAFYSFGQLAYAPQATHGAVAAVSTTFTQSSTNPFGWAAWTLALRPAKAAVTLSATFPSTPHVGDVVSFDVTATLVDGATGTLTITVDTLPAGLSLGSTSMVDSTHYKATVSGTLTTVQSVTSTFGATGGSVGATPLVHAFNVTAASTGVSYVASAAPITAAGSSIPIPSGCLAGDLMLLSYISTVAPTMPTGSTAIVADAVTWTPTRTLHTGSYGYFLTAANITAGSVAWTNNSSTAATASFWRGVHASIVDVQSALNVGTAVISPQTLSAAGITTTVNGDMLVFTGLVRSNGGASGTFTLASGFTDAVDNIANGSRSLTVQYQAQTTAGAVSGPSSVFANSNTADWAANLVALKPA